MRAVFTLVIVISCASSSGILHAESFDLSQHDGAIMRGHPRSCVGDEQANHLQKIIERMRTIDCEAGSMTVHLAATKEIPERRSRSTVYAADGQRHADFSVHDDRSASVIVMFGHDPKAPNGIDIYLIQRSAAAQRTPGAACYEHWHGTTGSSVAQTGGR